MNTFPLREMGFESNNLPESPNRRQRISMACQYCRHRKIRCCGGAPCRNCSRSNRECEYTPVPEEVNRATREKKAVARATKTVSVPNFSPYPGMSVYSPYMHTPPTYDMHYVPSPTVPSMSHLRPSLAGHRRTHSTPTYATPPAPLMSSPAMLESNGWMYNTTYTPTMSPTEHLQPKPLSTYNIPSFDYSPAVPGAVPPMPVNATPALDTSHRTPYLDIGLTGLGISTPSLQTPQYTAPMYTPASSSSSLSETPPHTPATHAPSYYSETLAPAIQLKPQPLMGLGIGMPSEPYGYTAGGYFSAV